VLRPEFVRRKLQLMVDDLGLLATFRDVDFEALMADPIRLAAVERIIERIVLRAIDVNEHLIGALATGDEPRTTRLTYRETFLRLADYGVLAPEFAHRIAASAGLRNVLVHDYNDVDRRILHGAIRSALEQYHAYVESIHRHLGA
jgi:uncharacterized protein YutE (UPF0331/DUF86 family)